MIPAQEALNRLKAGNREFVAEVHGKNSSGLLPKHRHLVQNQAPMAIILGCSDSRVPAEIVFNQSMGDLFVIRVAGNIVAPSQIGSIEFAAERFGTRLVVVLGHTECGAVEATVQELKRPSELRSPNLKAIVDRIRPSSETLLDAGMDIDSEEFFKRAVRANIRASVNHLKHGSHILENLIENSNLLVVGAEYSLKTGVVDFFAEK